MLFPLQAELNRPHPLLDVGSTPEMEFVKSKVQEIWTDQAFVSSQMDGCQEIGLVTLCFFLNFCFLMFLSPFPSMFPLLTYSQSFFSLSADHPRHSRRRRSKILIPLIQETV